MVERNISGQCDLSDVLFLWGGVGVGGLEAATKSGAFCIYLVRKFYFYHGKSGSLENE